MFQFLKYLGFEQVRQRGSHKFFRHSDGRTATVPVHKGEDLGSGIARSILRDIEISPEEFIKWRKKSF
jgi:predicted RNA binding protein YcfA (HicA-like mRNA interferase family)